jgi:hypothetical protein
MDCRIQFGNDGAAFQVALNKRCVIVSMSVFAIGVKNPGFLYRKPGLIAVSKV